MAPEGTMAFLSNDGVFLWRAGSRAAPTRFSEDRIPDQLRNVSPTANTITMAYDPTGRGFHLFITPAAAVVARAVLARNSRRFKAGWVFIRRNGCRDDSLASV